MPVSDQADLSTYDVERAPERACIRYQVCGNVVPGRGRICGPCLDEVRAADRKKRGHR